MIDRKPLNCLNLVGGQLLKQLDPGLGVHGILVHGSEFHLEEIPPLVLSEGHGRVSPIGRPLVVTNSAVVAVQLLAIEALSP